MEAGTHVDVPLVLGATAQETARDVPELTEAQYIAAIEASFGATLGALVLAQYPVADYPTPTDAYVAVTSDAKFVCAARTAARAAAGQRSAVYRYHFAYDGYATLGNNTATAFHGVELPYLFRSFAALGLPTNADDAVMIEQMGRAWTRFAATGTPELEGATWPAYDPAVDDAALLDVPPSIVEGVRTAQCDFWDGLLPG
jgi:para-nitrobenzyl esterase